MNTNLAADARTALIAWAEAVPRIRRVWVTGDRDMAIELEPVPDSEESIQVWIAHAEEWQLQLERCTGSHVDLEWFDPDVDAPLSGKAFLAYDRAFAS
jgi:hypothetical protein